MSISTTKKRPTETIRQAKAASSLRTLVHYDAIAQVAVDRLARDTQRLPLLVLEGVQNRSTISGPGILFGLLLRLIPNHVPLTRACGNKGLFPCGIIGRVSLAMVYRPCSITHLVVYQFNIPAFITITSTFAEASTSNMFRLMFAALVSSSLIELGAASPAKKQSSSTSEATTTSSTYSTSSTASAAPKLLPSWLQAEQYDLSCHGTLRQTFHSVYLATSDWHIDGRSGWYRWRSINPNQQDPCTL